MEFSVYHLAFIMQIISRRCWKNISFFQFDFAVPDVVIGEL
jgi:hypothetical protein